MGVFPLNSTEQTNASVLKEQKYFQKSEKMKLKKERREKAEIEQKDKIDEIYRKVEINVPNEDFGNKSFTGIPHLVGSVIWLSSAP